MSVRRCPTCSEELVCPELDNKQFTCGQCGARWVIISVD